MLALYSNMLNLKLPPNCYHQNVSKSYNDSYMLVTVHLIIFVEGAVLKKITISGYG